MPFEDTKILEFNQHRKSDKTPPIIFADFEYLIKRIDACKNQSSTTKLGKHVPCEYSMSMLRTFDGTENKHDVCRDFMIRFYEKVCIRFYEKYL